MCYADTNLTEFHKCLAGTTDRIMQLCPGSRAVNINFNVCLLRYSNVQVFTKLMYDTNLAAAWYQFAKSYVKNVTHKDIARLKLLSWLSQNSSDKLLRLDYGNVIYMDLCLGMPMIYGMDQCTRDLAPRACNRCLHGYIGLIRKFYLKNTSSSVKGYKCYLWFQLLPFHIMMLTSLPPPPPRASKGFIIILTIGGCVSFLVGKHISWTRLQEMDKDDLFNDEANDFEKSTGPRSSANATANFSDDHKLCEEGFGSGYTGIMRDSNIEIAVKRVSNTSKQGMKQFALEVRIISRFCHRNLVPLIGRVSLTGGNRTVTAPYLRCSSSMSSCSVVVQRPAHIYSPENSLPWPVRYNIVIGFSVALVYLQHKAEQHVLHRDIKPSNVILDVSVQRPVGDFGLSRLIDESRQLYTTGIADTLGYMDAQCFLAGMASIDSDIYIFGVFLLEDMCVLQDGGEYAIQLVQWVWDMHDDNTRMHNIADSLLLIVQKYSVSRNFQRGCESDEDDNTLKLNSMSCSTTNNYSGSGYMKNLDKLLSALSANAIVGDGFNTTVVSKGTAD
uniref:Protein kinase domain-containing protein n=1 Tax=Leersia perrieri TaxID=77586 RepID=A0A0D9XD14_9ORYZ